MELAVEWQHLLPSLFPCLLLWQELHRPPCKREQESPQCLVTAVPTPCHLPCGWRETLAREAGELGPLCVKNPLCLLSLAFSAEGHLSGLEFCLEESGREPQEYLQYQGHLPGLLHWEHNDCLICLMLLFHVHICRSGDWQRFK